MTGIGRFMGMTRRRHRLAAVVLTGLAAAGYWAGTAPVVEAAAPGVIVYTVTAQLPQFPCGSCSTTAISGTGVGAIHGAANFTAAPGKISGNANYFESGCPPLSGTANGVLTMTMKDGSAPATLTLNYHYQRTGLVAVITAANSTVADNSGAHATAVKGTSVGIFTAKNATAGELKPPCSSPAPLTVIISGVLVTT
jgi:hypothetical protein